MFPFCQKGGDNSENCLNCEIGGTLLQFHINQLDPKAYDTFKACVRKLFMKSDTTNSNFRLSVPLVVLNITISNEIQKKNM